MVRAIFYPECLLCKGKNLLEIAALSLEHQGWFAELEKRFWQKVDRQKATECWDWTAAKRGKLGYGAFVVGTNKHHHTLVAHRVAYLFYHKTLPPDLTLDHLCRHPSCVNPHHLDPVTIKINVLRGEGYTAQNARRTSCKNGHPFDEANTWIYMRHGRKIRHCRACMKNWGKQRDAKSLQKRAERRRVQRTSPETLARRCDICGKYTRTVTPGIYRCPLVFYDEYTGAWEHA